MLGCASIVTATVLVAGLLHADDGAQKEPMTREAFSNVIHRGLPRADVVAILGMPDEERASQDKGSTEWIYLDGVIDPTTGRTEQVTVIIFDEYQTVGDVRWADGTIAD
jgi:hypothetical protein